MKPRLQASKRVVSQSTSSKRNLRKEEKAKLSRGQKKDYEPEHEGIHQVSHRGDLLSHRHLPIQLLHGRTRIGKNQRQHQENNISTKVDSTYCVPTITIR